MLSTTASVSEPGAVLSANVSLKAEIFASIERLSRWLEENEYRGYDTFDGLSARFVRPLTLETKLLRTVLLQGVRRFPLNLRPVLGVTQEHSSKGMGFLARGFIRLHETTGDQAWAEKARVRSAMVDRKPVAGLQRGMLGQSLRLSVTRLLSAEGCAHGSVDRTDRARFSRCLRSFSGSSISSNCH